MVFDDVSVCDALFERGLSISPENIGCGLVVLDIRREIPWVGIGTCSVELFRRRGA